MGVLIDTSVLIDAERGRLDLAAHVARRPDDDAYLSVVTASELLHGVHRAATPTQRGRRSAFVEGLLHRFPVLDIDLATARAHARVWADLAVVGTRVGPNDLWLAAAAIAHGLTLVTANLREFERVPGLDVEGWGPDEGARP
ncbi:MAG: type II toxin-antitoxin system VapC family toxin [Trueperaceae bacterium]|nr:type II toxin-antitoxin system VapC family toxin [Trueperaceae bacterium]